jgi:hypothetical protein
MAQEGALGMSGTLAQRDLWGDQAFAALCLHEATHAAVALALGVTVEEASVAGTLRVDAATASLYGITAGDVPAGGTRIPDECLETNPREVLAAMAAPSCIATGVEAIDQYGALEAQWAIARAEERGLDPIGVLHLARTTAYAQRKAIAEIALALERDGDWHPSDAQEHVQTRDTLK